MTVSPRDADVIRAVLDDVCGACMSSDTRVFIAQNALDSLLARVHALEKALGRLASTQTFTTALDLDHAKPEALAAELRARGQFAEEAARAVVLEGAARQEQDLGGLQSRPCEGSGGEQR